MELSGGGIKAPHTQLTSPELRNEQVSVHQHGVLALHAARELHYVVQEAGGRAQGRDVAAGQRQHVVLELDQPVHVKVTLCQSRLENRVDRRQ